MKQTLETLLKEIISEHQKDKIAYQPMIHDCDAARLNKVSIYFFQDLLLAL